MSSEPAPDTRLPKRDYFLIPLIVILTLAVIGFGAEVGARLLWPEQMRDSCEITTGTSVHVQPNCTTKVKAAEGQWVEYRYNNCGFRSAAPCGPKPSNTVRLVLIGTSISRGYWVSYDDSFSGRLERDLTRSCGHPVEFQNLSVGAAQAQAWHTAALQGTRAAGLDPDAVVLVVSNFDLQQYAPSVPQQGAAQKTPPPKIDLLGLANQLRGLFASDSRAMKIAMHFAFSDPDRYLRFFLQHGDSADYLRPGLSDAWRARLTTVDSTVASLAQATHEAHVPLFLMLAPLRPGILLAHSQAEFPNLDGQAFPHALAEIAQRHGAFFVDPTALESAAPNWDKLYFVADGHPNGMGHQVLAAALRNSLLEHVEQLRGCATAPAPVNTLQSAR